MWRAAVVAVCAALALGDMTGYYYDNGQQQTVLDTGLGVLEREVM